MCVAFVCVFLLCDRLQECWVELNSHYYLAQARRIKKLKDRLNASTQQTMFVRHHFKIAYYYEFLDKLDDSIKCVVYWHRSGPTNAHTNTNTQKHAHTHTVPYSLGGKESLVVLP